MNIEKVHQSENTGNIIEEAVKLLRRLLVLENVQTQEELLSVEQIGTLRRQCVDYLNKMINIPLFDAEQIDARALETFAPYLVYISKIEEDYVPVGEIIVCDDGHKVRQIANCNRVKALQGKLNIDDTDRRLFNFPKQKNSDRLMECLNWIKTHDYPFQGNYILLFGDENTIMDGWHRAACLYYLYGNIKVAVHRVYFQKESYPCDQYIFPYDKVKRGSNVVIYGAGSIGETYVEQLKENNYCQIVGWTDSNWMNIHEKQLVSPTVIVKEEWDYIVIAVVADVAKREIENSLLKLGIPREKIVQRTKWL